MGELVLFQRVNQLLSEAEYPSRVHSLEDLRSFLNNEGNRGLPVYNEIEELGAVIFLGQGMW